MIKHCIIASVLALIPGSIIFGADLSDLKGKSLRQASDRWDVESSDYSFDSVSWCESDDYLYSQDEEQGQYYEEYDQEYDQEYSFDCDQCDDYYSVYSYDEYDAQDDLAELANVPHEHDFCMHSCVQKRENDLRKDCGYHSKYSEELRAIPPHEKVGRKIKRALFELSQREDLTNKISLRKAQRIANERSDSRRQDKMRKLLNIARKRVQKEAHREGVVEQRENQAAPEHEQVVRIKKNAKNLCDKANSWQPDAPEVVFEKRLQDAHRQFRPTVKKPVAISRNAPQRRYKNKDPKASPEQIIRQPQNQCAVRPVLHRPNEGNLWF